MNLAAPSTDLKELQCQNDLFISLKAEYEKAAKDLTKAQDINQLEVRAKKMVEDAKAEAAAIVSNAKRGVEQVQKTKCEYEALKAKIEESNKLADQAKSEALKLKAEAAAVREEAENLKAELKAKCEECDKVKAEAKATLEEFKDILVRFSGRIN